MRPLASIDVEGTWSGLVGYDDLPFSDRPFRLRMGLKPLDPRDWLEVEPDHDVQMARKAELLGARHDEVFGALPGSEPAAAEVLEAVVAHIGESPGPGALDQLHPLDAAGRLVQEDLCLHLPDADGGLRLVAGSVCFPSRWSLPDKLGLSVRDIHAPVAFYDEQLGAPVDQVLARLRPDRGVWRLNWSIHAEPDLFQPHRPTAPVDPGPPEDAGETLVLRVERQTLRRFPVHDSVLFTIRTHQRPLRSLEPRPDAAARLAAALRQMPEETVAYKGLTPVLPVALAYLDGLAAT